MPATVGDVREDAGSAIPPRNSQPVSVEYVLRRAAQAAPLGPPGTAACGRGLEALRGWRIGGDSPAFALRLRRWTGRRPVPLKILRGLAGGGIGDLGGFDCLGDPESAQELDGNP